MFQVLPLDKEKLEQIQEKIDLKTKPKGALGELESLALQLALITGIEKIELKQPVMLVFAGDHGIADRGVSIAPSEVTGQMVLNFLSGGAAINCFCKANRLSMEVIDAGIKSEIAHPQLISQALGAGTKDFSVEKAMTLELVDKGLSLGAQIVYQKADQGSNVFAFGEMGIGNTSSASALLSAFTGMPATESVGCGTGINQQAYNKKVALIEQALELHKKEFADIRTTLAALGGFEILQITGGMLAAAERGSVILVDGFIASIAAMAAIRIDENVRDYMVFCHQSEEKAHKALLANIQAKPLLDLGLRLGEGTGAALAMPLLRAAECFYNDMASFESAGVTAV
ncbi:nicotinate-nucleotide--dimethylbenzimidazole phosphoribosyltransferase [Aliikangiella sp. G2MR2-5]|uniref:nicotinate-nucleotide--dimethylbenzimidazole phosphoribosyltransferase n=1 Tax=Aliikangiella sp. G2MR2-5 TaxID=2788943 RepID=UPI0018ABCF54|nr:nicotinate-nucleotide--dimethylbenzimidazole phosphoribosyltransferase [Aliikangiella sp. G2MR2-5]